MYQASYCTGIVPPILHKMVPIYSAIHTIMGPSYVHQLFWGLTLAAKYIRWSLQSPPLPPPEVRKSVIFISQYAFAILPFIYVSLTPSIFPLTHTQIHT